MTNNDFPCQGGINHLPCLLLHLNLVNRMDFLYQYFEVYLFDDCYCSQLRSSGLHECHFHFPLFNIIGWHECCLIGRGNFYVLCLGLGLQPLISGLYLFVPFFDILVLTYWHSQWEYLHTLLSFQYMGMWCGCFWDAPRWSGNPTYISFSAGDINYLLCIFLFRYKIYPLSFSLASLYIGLRCCSSWSSGPFSIYFESFLLI